MRKRPAMNFKRTNPIHGGLSRVLATVVAAVALLLAPGAFAQFPPVEVGSDGSDGAINITADTTLDLPEDGIINATTVDVAAGATLRFNLNTRNTAVQILAQSDVTIAGTMDVSGEDASADAAGRGGPGGYDGGIYVDDSTFGEAHGPGGTAGDPQPTRNFVSPLLIPLIGGSGRGGAYDPDLGTPGRAENGGGGGGALLIGSNTRITLTSTGSLLSLAGLSEAAAFGRPENGRGSIRLVAQKVVIEDDGDPDEERIDCSVLRIDSYDFSEAVLGEYRDGANGSVTTGTNFLIEPSPQPRLDILEVAGTPISEGAAPVVIDLGNIEELETTITVQARDFGATVPVSIVLQPEVGDRSVVSGQINNLTQNPASEVFPITLPANVTTAVHVWLAAGQTIFRESFEEGLGEWTISDEIWQIGSPTSGPNGTHDGSASLAGTILGGNYTDNTSSRLVSPSIQIPAADLSPRLRFWHWYSFNSYDSGEVQISVAGGDWDTISPVYTVSGSGVWSYPAIDLSVYGGQSVRFGFLFKSVNSGSSAAEVSSGWYIDEVEVVTGVQVFTNPEGFEGADFWDHWDADFSIWEFGEPASGPGAAYAGSNVAATILGGDYTDNRSSRLMSPGYAVPQAGENPRLRFWHWYSFNSYDSGEVQISVAGGDWETISPVYTVSGSGVWSYPAIDLTAYAGQSVRFGFLFKSVNSGSSAAEVSSGWYIDEVEVVTGAQVFTNPEGFEGADFWDHWDADFSVWEFGEPASGPGAAYAGSNVAATILGGNYTDDRSSRLMSPSFAVPGAGENPLLRFWHWYSFNSYDSGEVQISVAGGDWETISPVYTASGSGLWSYPAIDLSAYAGQSVRFGFLFKSVNSGSSAAEVSSGWYVDELQVVTGP